MPVVPTDDQQLDPLEQADLDVDESDDDGASQPHDDAVAASELDPDIVAEIDKVMVHADLVEDGTSVKAKQHMLPENLISTPLQPHELWDDDGTI